MTEITPKLLDLSLELENESRENVAAWESLELSTRNIMLTHIPDIEHHIAHCKRVVSIVDDWRSKHE
jgi:hypothetical protein